MKERYWSRTCGKGAHVGLSGTTISALVTHLLNQFPSPVSRDHSRKFLEQSPRQGLNEAEVIRFVKTLFQVFCYSADIGEIWGNEVDCRHIG